MRYKVIMTQGQTRLVKARGKYYWLPLWSDDISKAVPYSVDWSEFVPQALADTLISREVHTLDDLRRQPALASLTLGHGVDYYGLIIKVQERYNGK